MSDILRYDRTFDPQDHVIPYITKVNRNYLTKQDIKSVPVKKFGETFTKGALTLYSFLSENSIILFAELADAFLKAHRKLRSRQRIF